ncbi:MAG: hypothetical protein Q8S03_17235 [Brevundimonas sp.]|uniref:hypothetical protein n=1 Tax=Brevundimonas sp. TaxID=1871086 RepID=UPI00273484F6|nr:hypothetical protein [Brevundimonas sp.]MDP3406438.1 hypothetical protein [Brevundimonas sp.]
MTPNPHEQPGRPSQARDALTAYQVAAWRAPGATRFDARPANDFLARADAIAPRTLSARPVEADPLPRWVVVAAGAVVSALLGAVLGNLLAF